MDSQVHGFGFDRLKAFDMLTYAVERVGKEAAFFYIPVNDSAAVQRAQYDILDRLEKGVELEVVEPENLHITLLYIETITDDEIEKIIERLNVIMPVQFDVGIVSVGTFPEPEKTPLVLHVDPDVALLRIQFELYNAAFSLAHPVSKFSEPSRYKPHITIANNLMPPDTKIPKLAAPFKVPISRFVVSRPEYERFYTVHLPVITNDTVLVRRGGPGSGYFEHEGRPNEDGTPMSTFQGPKEKATYAVTRSALLQMLRGEPLVVGSLRRSLAISDGPFVIIDDSEETITRIPAPVPVEFRKDEITSLSEVERGIEIVLHEPGKPVNMRERIATILTRFVNVVLRSVGIERGGPGSGHFEHEGRPGEVGGSLPSDGVTVGDQPSPQMASDAMKRAFGSTGDEIESAAWIAPDGEGLAPNEDHQETAVHVLDRLGMHPDTYRTPLTATVNMVDLGLVRYTRFHEKNAFSLPSENLTNAQKETIVSIMLRIKGRDPRADFSFDRAFAGGDRPEFISLRGRQIVNLLDLNTDFWDVAGLSVHAVIRGGEGSGHFEHEGRPDEVGGSLPSGEHAEEPSEAKKRSKSEIERLSWSAGKAGLDQWAESYFTAKENPAFDEMIEGKDYVYISVFRPLGSWADLPEGVLFFGRLVYSDKPLDFDTLLSLELAVISDNARGTLMKELYENIYGETGTYVFKNPKENYVGAIIHPTISKEHKEKYPWRATTWDLYGFRGHSVYKSIEEALAEQGRSMGYTEPFDPEIFERIVMMDDFQEGIRINLERQREFAKKMVTKSEDEADRELERLQVPEDSGLEVPIEDGEQLLQEILEALGVTEPVERGGLGSGHFGHEGRPGEIGGALPVPARLKVEVAGPMRRISIKHFGPGTHPGAGTEQQVHAGDRANGKGEWEPVGSWAPEHIKKVQGNKKASIRPDPISDSKWEVHLSKEGIQWVRQAKVAGVIHDSKEQAVELADKFFESDEGFVPYTDYLSFLREGEWSEAIERHHGPGPHPGTGTEQQVHAGGGKRAVGITSAREGKLSKQVFTDMRAFESSLSDIESLSSVSVKPGLGGWEGGSESTWIVSFRGNGDATALIAETAKQHDQDGVLLMDPCNSPGDCSPVVDWHFTDPVTPSERDNVEKMMVDEGIGGWTWYKREGGFGSLRAVSVPQWGGDRETHLSVAERLRKLFDQADMPHEFEVGEVRVSVMNREGENSYDEFMD